MTTRKSPTWVLKNQADKIAATLKAIERGEKINTKMVEKIEAARNKENIKFGIVMDDKIVMIEISWTTLRAADEKALAEVILGQMLREIEEPG